MHNAKLRIVVSATKKNNTGVAIMVVRLTHRKGNKFRRNRKLRPENPSFRGKGGRPAGVREIRRRRSGT